MSNIESQEVRNEKVIRTMVEFLEALADYYEKEAILLMERMSIVPLPADHWLRARTHKATHAMFECAARLRDEA